MKLYWTITSIPELKGLTSEDRKRIWQECYREAWKHWQVWLSFMVFPIIILTMGFFIDLILHLFPGLPYLILPLFIALYVMAGSQIFVQVVLRFTRDYVKKHHDIP
jgi:hypothetical protein